MIDVVITPTPETSYGIDDKYNIYNTITNYPLHENVMKGY